MGRCRHKRYYGYLRGSSFRADSMNSAYNQRHMHRSALCFPVLLIVLAALPASAKDLALVVNKANPFTGLTLSELTKLFKSTNKKWPDGKDVMLVLPDPASPEMKIAAYKIYGKPPEEVKTLIDAANQSRKGSVLFVNSSDVLIKTVETNPGCIGVVDVYSITSGVHVLKIDGKSPLEPGYLLHGN